jgi:hypothetical protein
MNYILFGKGLDKNPENTLYLFTKGGTVYCSNGTYGYFHPSDYIRLLDTFSILQLEAFEGRYDSGMYFGGWWTVTRFYTDEHIVTVYNREQSAPTEVWLMETSLQSVLTNVQWKKDKHKHHKNLLDMSIFQDNNKKA